ncbi:zinc finger protein 664-like [Agrilus planipennis]|uniref:Zinc finger protein 664-like n=1 Tax=Agrilus planipennis TaxID=224129 RepID=A0A7F5R8J2_AGRPL|nr:zinc finger protein 664-like [Agrilus planipennis]
MFTCRLCLHNKLEKQEIVSIRSDNIQLLKRIKDCVSLDIKENAALPGFVCLLCIQKITDWENFKHICQQSNAILLEKLHDSKDVLYNNPYLDNEKKLSISEDVKNENTYEEQFFENDLEQPKLLSSGDYYVCDICCEEFDNCFDYLDHQERHNGEPVFRCDICFEVFSFRKDLVFHDQNHKTRCPYCSKDIIKSGMKLHLIIHTDRFKCDKCGGRFNSRCNLDIHMIKVHTNIKTHVCDTCGKCFSCQSSLKVHLRTHSEKRLYRCTECDYMGRTAAALYAHKTTHSYDLRVCQHCPKTFKSGRNLKDHLRRVHSKEKKHRCPKCNKTFVDKYMLSIHQRWHTGDRRYKCNICSKAFIRSDGLNNHMDTHEFHAKYDCQRCGKKFKMKRSVVRHTCTANSISNE